MFRERREKDKELDQAMEEVDLMVALQAGPEVVEQDMPLVAMRREEV